jgi:hypothetical protein
MTSTPEQELSATSSYLLGSDEPELARLDIQAAALAPSTRLLLRGAVRGRPRGRARLIRTLAPQIVAAGIAGEAELDLDGYEPRLARALMESGSVFLPPALAGAWGVAA